MGKLFVWAVDAFTNELIVKHNSSGLKRTRSLLYIVTHTQFLLGKIVIKEKFIDLITSHGLIHSSIPTLPTTHIWSLQYKYDINLRKTKNQVN